MITNYHLGQCWVIFHHIKEKALFFHFSFIYSFFKPYYFYFSTGHIFIANKKKWMSSFAFRILELHLNSLSNKLQIKQYKRIKIYLSFLYSFIWMEDPDKFLINKTILTSNLNHSSGTRVWLTFLKQVSVILLELVT